MKKFKSTVITLAFIVIVVSLAGGAVYFVKEQRDREWEDQLALVKGFISAEKFEDAQTALIPLLAKDKSSVKGANLRVLYMDILLKNNAVEDAQTVGLELVAKHPESDAATVARCLLGKIALNNNEPDQAEEHFQAVLDQGSDTLETNKARLGMALVKQQRGLRNQAFTKQAKDDLDQLLDEEDLTQALTEEVEAALGEVNVALLLSLVKLPDDLTYKIVSGDTIDGIARQHGLTPEILLRCNGISDPRMLTENTRIKVPQIKFSMLVDKWTNTLLLMNDGKFFKRYSVRTGSYADDTPNGEFKIIHKKKNPQWVDPRTHRTFPPNDPENELGTRWMAFEGSMLGIHGTIHPESIGLYTSNGCVGMLKDDIEELFDLVREGTPLEIIGSQNPKILELSGG